MRFQRFVWQGEGPQSFTSKGVVYLHCWPLMMWIPSCSLAKVRGMIFISRLECVWLLLLGLCFHVILNATIHVKYGFAAAEPWNILATEPRSTLLNKMAKMTGSSPLATGLEYYQMPKNHVVLLLWFWCFWYLDHFTKLLDFLQYESIALHRTISYFSVIIPAAKQNMIPPWNHQGGSFLIQHRRLSLLPGTSCIKRWTPCILAELCNWISGHHGSARKLLYHVVFPSCVLVHKIKTQLTLLQ